MGDPGAVEPSSRLAALVLGHLRERDLIGHGIAPVRDQCRHAADGVRTALVARLHEELRVRPHEGHGHGDLRAVGQHERGVLAEFLDHAEDVVPASGVEPRRVLAERVQDRVHLEGGGDRLDQDRRAKRAARNVERLLHDDEDVVPERGLVGVLELREVERRRAPPLELRASAMDRKQGDVEQARRDGLIAQQHVSFDQVPAAGAHEHLRDRVVQAVLAPLGRCVPEGVTHDIAQRGLTADDVREGRRERVLEIDHEAVRARVERVDHHARLGRTVISTQRRSRSGGVVATRKPGSGAARNVGRSPASNAA